MSLSANSNDFPRMLSVRQVFPPSKPIDIDQSLREQFETSGLSEQIKPQQRIAIAVGSRAVSNLEAVLRSVIEIVRARGAKPFVVAAMGSHGGGAAEGQREVLATYGITEETVGVPIHTSMDVEQLGTTEDGIKIHFSTEAYHADGIIIVNRVKPHTDFTGGIGSGILKMMVIGLGKRTGAATFHAAASRLGYEHVIRSAARLILKHAPILCGVALVEDQFHQTAQLEVIQANEIESKEEQLMLAARVLLARLPFAEIDLLIVDHIGKNISGAGMDPNVTGRGVQGYSPLFARSHPDTPNIRRIFVRDLTPETHGNAIGIGLADFTTARAIRATDLQVSYINSLTALSPQTIKLPIYFATDREAISNALTSLALNDVHAARIVRISDTLSLESMQVSEAYLDEIAHDVRVQPVGEVEDMKFDSTDNLLPLPRNH
jgi:lactate racemase-like protein